MPGLYAAVDLEIQYLIGKKILSAEIATNDRDETIVRLNGDIYLCWLGGCCSTCYLQHVSGSENIINATILEAENSEWEEESKTDFEEVNQMGTKIRTDKGWVTFESRHSSNGYYSGEIAVYKDFPSDQYSTAYDPKDLVFKPLEDF